MEVAPPSHRPKSIRWYLLSPLVNYHSYRVHCGHKPFGYRGMSETDHLSTLARNRTQKSEIWSFAADHQHKSKSTSGRSRTSTSQIWSLVCYQLHHARVLAEIGDRFYKISIRLALRQGKTQEFRHLGFDCVLAVIVQDIIFGLEEILNGNYFCAVRPTIHRTVA